MTTEVFRPTCRPTAGGDGCPTGRLWVRAAWRCAWCTSTSPRCGDVPRRRTRCAGRERSGGELITGIPEVQRFFREAGDVDVDESDIDRRVRRQCPHARQVDPPGGTGRAGGGGRAGAVDGRGRHVGHATAGRPGQWGSGVRHGRTCAERLRDGTRRQQSAQHSGVRLTRRMDWGRDGGRDRSGGLLRVARLWAWKVGGLPLRSVRGAKRYIRTRMSRTPSTGG